MRLFSFILGVLGAILIIGAFSSFLPLVFLGGIATGSIAFAFGLPLFLIIIGATMVYFGFYYKDSNQHNNDELISIGKWGIIYTIAILISSYVMGKIMFANDIYTILSTALIISIIVQIVRSHDSDFKFKWFIFYFLVYANILWIMEEYILPKIFIQTGFFSSLVVGFSIAGIVIILQKIKMKHNSVPWASIILILVFLVANLGSLQDTSLQNFIKFPSNTSELSENNQACPLPISNNLPLSLNEVNLRDAKVTSPQLMNLINSSVWQTENFPKGCYKGKYVNQNPNWFYCDDMILSRWEMNNYGTIKYRWYTAVTSVWQSPEGSNPFYKFYGFACENGQKVTVEKGVTNYYVYDSRDGTQIRIKY